MEACEAIRKGAQTSYKARGKKEKQEALFPELKAVIDKKRQERTAGVSYTAEERFGDAYLAELRKLAKDRIGGEPHEQQAFFEQVIAKYPDVYWIEGCPAPTVRSS